MMKSINLLKKRLIEAEVNFTDYLSNALWLLPDGTMIDGEYDYGNRGQDHRIIESGIVGLDRYDGRKFWDACHKDYKLVRLVPETGYAMISPRQKLTQEQESILKYSNYEIEKY